jgi:hypothetical protein
VLGALGFLWTLPNTLLGLFLGLLTFQKPRVVSGAIVFDRASRGASAALRLIHRTAMTVGVVIVANRPLDPTLLAHERHHIRQYRQWGPFFIPVYLLLAVPFGYRRHPFERAATQAAAKDAKAKPKPATNEE